MRGYFSSGEQAAVKGFKGYPQISNERVQPAIKGLSPTKMVWKIALH